MISIAILDDIHHAYEHTPAVRRLRERANVRIFSAPFGEASALRGVEAIVANRERTRFSRELIEQLSDVRLIVQTGNHVHHIDLVAAEACGIIVAQASGGYSIGAAELAMGLALALMRQIPASDRAIRAGAWPTPYTRVLHGKTLGIVGLGRVGRHTARIAAAFGMRVVAWGPRLTDAVAASAGVERLALDDLLRSADVVSIHAAFTAESRRLIDARRIGLMKPDAYLVNTARGAIVDEPSLVDALRQRKIAGAGLDVFDEEPLPAGHPLTGLSNVILTPHMGWPTDEAYARFADAACDVVLAYLDGREFPRFSKDVNSRG